MNLYMLIAKNGGCLTRFKVTGHEAKIIKVYLRSYSVAMVTSCVGGKTLNYLTMIGNLYDTIIEAIMVVLIYQTMSAKK